MLVKKTCIEVQRKYSKNTKEVSKQSQKAKMRKNLKKNSNTKPLREKQVISEIIPKDNLSETAARRLLELKQALRVCQRSCSSDKEPAERLRVLTKGKAYQYYVVPKVENSAHSTAPNTNGTYLKARNRRRAAVIAQFDYDKKIVQQLQHDIAILQSFIDNYHTDDIDKIYAQLHPGRKRLITPARLSDDAYIMEWQSKPVEGKSFEHDTSEFFTNDGLRVRSKSEIIIANELTKAGVPFRYEAPINLESHHSITIHPDFTCLNIQTRQEVIWEHFGLMTSPDYVRNAIHKIALYSANGFILGKNLIATFEGGETTLSVKQVKQYVNLLANCTY